MIFMGESKWDGRGLEGRPATVSCVLKGTSSRITDRTEASSPLIDGTGASNVDSSPVDGLIILLPMKKSPSLFIAVYTTTPPDLF